MNIGQSLCTPWKEFCFQELLESFMETAKYPLSNAANSGIPAVFHLYDLYAGIGVNDYGESSTVIFYNKLNCVGGLTGRYNLTAVEKDKKNYATLRENIGYRDITLINNSASRVIENIPNDISGKFGEKTKHAVGVVFLDPNGVVKEPEYKSLVKLSKECPNINIVANMSVTQLYRNRGVKKTPGFSKYNHIGKLTNWQKDMNRKHLYGRSIVGGGGHKWTIVVLTNTPLKGIKSPLQECGFYNIKSDAGKRIFSEVDKKQLTIF